MGRLFHFLNIGKNQKKYMNLLFFLQSGFLIRQKPYHKTIHGCKLSILSIF